MSRRLCVVLALSLALAGLGAADEKKEGPKEKEPDYTVYSPYFEKNNSGLKGDSSYLAIKDKAAFDKIFGSGRVMKQNPAPKLLDGKDFKKQLVIAVIKRGNQITQYTVNEVKVTDGKVSITYIATAKGNPGGTARFASPLVVGIAKGKTEYKNVEFIERKDAKDKGTVHTVKIGK